MSWVDYALAAVIVALVVADIVYLRRRKKRCSGCSACPYAGSCERIRKKKK